jgi:hypothetical protein
MLIVIILSVILPSIVMSGVVKASVIILIVILLSSIIQSINLASVIRNAVCRYADFCYSQYYYSECFFPQCHGTMYESTLVQQFGQGILTVWKGSVQLTSLWQLVQIRCFYRKGYFIKNILCKFDKRMLTVVSSMQCLIKPVILNYIL